MVCAWAPKILHGLSRLLLTILLTQAPPDRSLLQTLVGIDNEKCSFAAQLLKAARIVQVEDVFIPTLNRPLELQKVLRRPAFTAKHEWVLRWLLNKLQTQDGTGSR